MTTPQTVSQQQVLKAALEKLEKLQAELQATRRMHNEPIAIIGMGLRFPGNSHTPDALWHMLDMGTSAISAVPATRWDLERYYSPDPEQPGKMYVRHMGCLESIEMFDAPFFEIAPREAQSLDPQHRLLLEVSWEALEHANLVPQHLFGSLTGVFIGISSFDHSIKMTKQLDATYTDAYFGTGNSHSTAAGRLSYFLRFTGPNMAIDTACSSSLVALHLACQSLRQHECHLALAGGVNVILSPTISIAFSKARMLSADGRCKTFDAGADGYVRSEGCGILVLKRLTDALKDGNQILALIRGSAINQDGPSSGLTVPSGLAQEAVIRQALQNAGVTPEQIGYIEAHGTGTFLGDPIEANTLAEVFGNRSPDNPLYVGSIKTNLGHMEAAAGIAGMIKAVLMVQHRIIPQHLNFQQLNPHINWAGRPLVIPTVAVDWQTSRNRLAGVSSFGFSGTNAHVIVEEAPALVPPVATPVNERPLHVLTLAARTPTALRTLAERYAHLATTDTSWADICFTANTCRTPFAHRLGVVSASVDEARQALHAFAHDKPPPYMQSGLAQETPRIAFFFTGQGAQYPGMGRELYETQPVFRQTIDRCADILAPFLDVPLLQILYPDPASADTNLIDQTAYTQPAIFALEYALATLWQAWGVQPDVVLGHSIGEYVAACIAGVFSLEDGLRFIAERGRLMQALPAPGCMVAINASVEQVKQKIAPYAEQVAIAALNAPEHVVISGEQAAVAAIVTDLHRVNIRTQQLAVSHAFHSPLMLPMLDDFAHIARQITFAPPRRPLIANLHGTLAGDDMATPDYWCAHVRQPVQFAASIATLQHQSCHLLLEVGPQPTLLALARQCVSDPDAYHWLPSLRKDQTNWQTLLRSLAALFIQGVPIDWAAFDRDDARQRVQLPTYPFQRQRYWLDADPAQLHAGPATHPLLGQPLALAGTTALHFTQSLSQGTASLVRDHQIFGTTVMPAAAYVEMALAAGQVLFTTSQLTLSGMQIEQMLPLSDTPTQIQIKLTPRPDGQRATFEIFSLAAVQATTTWTRHANGVLEPASADPTASAGKSVTLPAYADMDERPVAPLYHRLHVLGMHFGLNYQTVTRLWQRSEEALGYIQVPASLTADAAAFILHPSLLDGCLHVIDCIDSAPGRLALPRFMRRMTVHRSPGTCAWSYVQSRSGPGSSNTVDLHIFTADGTLAAEIEGLHVEQVNRNALRRMFQGDVRSWLYQVDWDARPSVPPTSATLHGRWLILSDSGGLGQQLAARLQSEGATCALALPGATYARCVATDGTLHYRLNPASPHDFRALATEQWDGVVYLWGLDPVSEAELDTWEEPQQRLCGGAMHLAQALVQMPDPPRLWLVTHDAQPDPVAATPLQLAAAPLWGLGQVLSVEHPELQCVCVDLDAREPLANLLATLNADASENQVRYRAGERYVARLVRYNQRPGQLSIPDGPFQLKVAASGSLHELTLAPVVQQPPDSDEVEIQIHAAGLNFRDVLNALGMLKGFVTDAMADIPLGGEGVGMVTACGANVTHVQPGDQVIAAFALGSLGSFVRVHAALVFPCPPDLSAEAAATLPIAFLTAYYGLNVLARIQPGDRVLIHAAAGGVGQAAVQLAQRAGAEIFATASPGKWDYLQQQGINHVLNSRTVDFADTIMTLTDGQGVDIVLNSLNGEFIPCSLDVLAQGGRFVEIGKIDILTPEQMQDRRPDVAYFPFDLLDVARADPPLMRSMFTDLLTALQSGHLTPLPLRTFPIQNAIDAFRYMAQARHIGKVVITLPAAAGLPAAGITEMLPIRADGTYLITGGLGGLGLHVAAWLVANGARQLALVGRRGITTDAARATLHLLEGYGTQVRVITADVSCQSDVMHMLADIQATMPALRGIIHAAGITQDATVMQQTWEHMRAVLAPKVAGGWYLHSATRYLPLDFFVCFSSFAALFGPGQSNYAAANLFLDALVHHRRALGLPALSINWGPWAEVGMAARLEQHHQSRQAAVGIQPFRLEQGLHVLEWAFTQPHLTQIAPIVVDWAAFTRLHRAPLFAALASTETTEPTPEMQVLKQVQAAPAAEHHALLLRYVQTELARILGLAAPDQVRPNQRFFQMGLDSLMAVELRNSLERDLGIAVQMTTIFNYPTTETLTTYLLGAIIGTDKPQTDQDYAAVRPTTTDFVADAVLDAQISPPVDALPPQTSPQTALLTGASGFLGAFLLADLLKHTPLTIYCLVRAADADQGLQRLRRNLERYRLGHAALTDNPRIKIVAGDLALPQFGLSAETYHMLAETIDIIYHNAAMLDLVQPYSVLQPVNVQGTQEIIRLASQVRIKPVQHMSTVAMFFSTPDQTWEIVRESDHPDYTRLRDGYVQSKWVAEQLIFQAHERGIPTTVYRLGIITGDSQTGCTNDMDLTNRMVRGCYQMGMVPDWGVQVNLVPVDYVSRAIVHLSQHAASRGQIFHVANPRATPINAIVAWANQIGYSFATVPYDRWRTELLQHAREGRQNPLVPLLPLFAPRQIDYQIEQWFDCQNVLNGLAGTDITCPPIESLFDNYYSYIISSGIMEPPSGT